VRRFALHIALAVSAVASAAALADATFSAYSSASANAGSTFATAASYGSTCPNTTVTNGFVTGFETGRRGYSLGTVTAGNAAMSIDGSAGAARTGAYSMKVATSGTTGYGQWQWLTLPYPTTQVARFALRLDAQPSTDVTQLFSMGSSGATVQLRYLVATNRFAVAIRRDATTAPTVVSGTTAAEIGRWHVLDFRYDVAGTPHTVDWRVDGTAQPSASTPATSTTISTTQFGNSAAAETFQAHYDDVLVSRDPTQYPLADGRVFALRPNGTGTSVNPQHFQDDDGTALDATSWQRLDEAPMDSLTDYIQQVTNGASSYAELTLDDTTETCIRAAHATFSTHSPSTNQRNDLKISAFDGATESIIKQGDMAANTTVSRNYAAPVTPATSWTRAAVNGLVVRWGYGADVTPLQSLDSVVVEIESPR
jgi:hypothetical protein